MQDAASADVVSEPSEGGVQAGPHPSVLVVIPCLNEELHIRSVLSYACGEMAGFAGTIVVADGMSSDRTVAIVREIAAGDPRVRVIENRKRIQSAAVNLAVEQFGRGHDVLIRLDAHAGYPQGLFAALLASASRHGCEAVAVPMVAEGTEPLQRAIASAQNSVIGNGGSRHRRAGQSGFVDHGHHALIRLDAYRAIGGYDETFSHNEDAEFDRRLTQNGGRIWLNGDTPIIYYPRRSLPRLFRQFLAYGRGRARNVLKHRSRPRLRQLVMLSFAPGLVFAILIGLGLPLAAVLLAFCVVAGVVMALRSGRACDLLAGVAALTMHVGWSAGFWLEIADRLRRRLVDGRPKLLPQAKAD